MDFISLASEIKYVMLMNGNRAGEKQPMIVNKEADGKDSSKRWKLTNERANFKIKRKTNVN